MLVIKIALKFLIHNIRKFLFLFLTLFFGSAIFYVSFWTTSTYVFDYIQKSQYLILSAMFIFISLAIFMIATSVISYSINQKKNQIGVLKALGLSKIYINLTFILHSSTLGLLASVLGLLLANVGMKFFRFLVRDENNTPMIELVIDKSLYIISFFVAIVAIILSTFNSLRKANIKHTVDLLKE